MVFSKAFETKFVVKPIPFLQKEYFKHFYYALKYIFVLNRRHLKRVQYVSKKLKAIL